MIKKPKDLQQRCGNNSGKYSIVRNRVNSSVVRQICELQREEALLTGCRPCGYILKCILCLSLQCKGPLAEGFECPHGHAGVSKEG